jgi:hypothetical protein
MMRKEPIVHRCWRFLRLIISTVAVLVSVGLCVGSLPALFQVYDAYHRSEISIGLWIGATALILGMLVLALSQMLFSIGVLLRGGRSSNQAMKLTATAVRSGEIC